MTRDLTNLSDAAWFWRFIGSGDGAIEHRVAAIKSRLETATDDDLADFDRLLRQAMARLDSNELVAAVYLLMGYVSDRYVSSWMRLGVYENADSTSHPRTLSGSAWHERIE